MLFCHSFPIFLPIVSTRHCCHCLPTHPTACGPLYPSPKIPDPLLDPAHTHPHRSPPCLAALVTPLGLGHYLSDYFSIGIPHHSWAPTSCASFPTLWNPSLLPTPCLRAPLLSQPPFHLTHGHIFIQPYLILGINCSEEKGDELYRH